MLLEVRLKLLRWFLQRFQWLTPWDITRWVHENKGGFTISEQWSRCSLLKHFYISVSILTAVGRSCAARIQRGLLRSQLALGIEPVCNILSSVSNILPSYSTDGGWGASGEKASCFESDCRCICPYIICSIFQNLITHIIPHENKLQM